MNRRLLLLTVCFILLNSCNKPANPNWIILSYSEDNSYCLDCPSFRVDFRNGGHVTYECLRGCPAPGEQWYAVPRERFTDLVRAFHDERFFDIPRTDPTRIVFDVTVIRLTFRDAGMIHEVVDDGRKIAGLGKLEDRFRVLTGLDRFRKPSLALYRGLVNAGWNVNTVGADQQNALYSAASFGDLESARFLLKHGARINPASFSVAAMLGHFEVFRVLVESSNGELPRDVQTAVLIQAAGSSNVDLLRYVLDLGADPNLGDNRAGETPLISAVESGQLQNTALLLSRGANANASDNSGRRALWFAAAATNTGFVTLLLKYKADVNATDNAGKTALMNAVDSCYTWNVEALLKGRADPTLRDKAGRKAQVYLDGDPKCKATKALLVEAADLKRQ